MSTVVKSNYGTCQRCGGGPLLNDYGKPKCFQCWAEHDEDGNLITPKRGDEMSGAIKRFTLTPNEGTYLRAKVLKALKYGRQSAIRGNDLARMLNQPDDRKVRLVIRELIAEGVPISSSVTEPMGYFVVANEHEAANYIRVLKERIKEDTARLTDFEKAVDHFQLPEQLALR